MTSLVTQLKLISAGLVVLTFGGGSLPSFAMPPPNPSSNPRHTRLVTRIPSEAVGPFFSLAFNQSGDFVASAAQSSVNSGGGSIEEQVELKRTDFFFFDQGTKTIRKVFEIPNLVNFIKLTDERKMIFENFTGIRQTDGVFTYDIRNSELQDLSGEWLTRSHHRFSFAHYAPLAPEGERYSIAGTDSQDLLIWYQQIGGEFQRRLWTEFRYGQKEGINCLFKPSMNRFGDALIKVQIGAREDIFETPAYQKLFIVDHENRNRNQMDQARVIATTRLSSDPLAPTGIELLSRISNAMALNDQKNAVFFGEKQRGTPTQIWFYQNSTKSLVSHGGSDLSGEFAPALNNQDQVVFRSTTKQGKRSLVHWNPKLASVETLVAEGDSVDGLTLIRLLPDFHLSDQNEAYFVAELPASSESSKPQYGLFTRKF